MAYTAFEDLPEVQEYEEQLLGQNMRQIRGRHIIPEEAGMGSGFNPIVPNKNPEPVNEFFHEPQFHEKINTGKKLYHEPVLQNVLPPDISPMDLNCRAIAEHADGCTICSKLYDNKSMIYITIIVALLIIILFMGKRIMDQKI